MLQSIYLQLLQKRAIVQVFTSSAIGTCSVAHAAECNVMQCLIERKWLKCIEISSNAQIHFLTHVPPLILQQVAILMKLQHFKCRFLIWHKGVPRDAL